MATIPILYISLTEKISGGERSVFQYIQQLDREKYVPILLCPASGMLSEFAQTKGVRVVFHRLSLFSLCKPWQYISDLFWLIVFLQREKIQIIHGMSFYTAQLAGPASKITHIPLIIHGQNIFSSDEAKKAIKRNRLHDCTNIICCSEAVAKPLRAFLPNDTLVILYHAVPIPEQLSKKTWFLHKELDLTKKTKLIGHIGLLEERKCQDVLICAAKIVLQKHKNVAFLLIGDALFDTQNYKLKLAQLVQELGLQNCVFFLGFRNDIAKIIPELDIATLPSYNEPLAMASLEMCSYGLPYVGTYTGGTSEIIVHKKSGLLVQPRDSKKLADALCYMLEHPKQAARMGKHARESIARNCNIKKNSTILFSIYETLL